MSTLPTATADDDDLNLITYIQDTSARRHIYSLPVGELVAAHCLPSHPCLVGKVEGVKELCTLGYIFYFNKKIGLLVTWVSRCIKYRRYRETNMHLTVCRINIADIHGRGLTNLRPSVLGASVTHSCTLVAK